MQKNLFENGPVMSSAVVDGQKTDAFNVHHKNAISVSIILSLYLYFKDFNPIRSALCCAFTKAMKFAGRTHGIAL